MCPPVPPCRRGLLEETRSIKVTSSWRKVQELLDEDPRYLALEKEDRLIVFEDYIRCRPSLPSPPVI